MARAMVINYGFSDIGPWSLMDQGAQSQDMIMRMMSRNSISESLQRKIDEAVKTIAAQAYEIALQHIRCVYVLHCLLLWPAEGSMWHAHLSSEASDGASLAYVRSRCPYNTYATL